MFPHGVTVHVSRPGGTDRYGHPLPGTEHDIPGCAAAPRSSEERTDGAATVTTGLSLFAPYGADLEPQDELTIPGYDGVWQIEGDPADWRSPFTGRESGTVVPLMKGTG